MNNSPTSYQIFNELFNGNGPRPVPQQYGPPNHIDMTGDWVQKNLLKEYQQLANPPKGTLYLGNWPGSDKNAEGIFKLLTPENQDKFYRSLDPTNKRHLNIMERGGYNYQNHPAYTNSRSVPSPQNMNQGK